MPLKSGMAAQFGVIQEASYGVPLTVTRFLPFSSESIKQDIARIQSKGILAGRRTVDTTQWVPGEIKIGGSVNMELFDHSMGPILNNMFGSSVITGAGPYTNTNTPGDLTGKSLCVQVGRPSVSAGVVQPFTYPGCKIPKWSVSAQAGQIAQLDFDILGLSEIRFRQSAADGVTTISTANLTSASAAFTQDDVGKPVSGSITGIPVGTTILSVTSPTAAVLSANATATTASNVISLGVPLATASYTVQNPVSYVGGSLTVAGSSVPIKSFTLSGETPFDDSRRFLGTQLLAEPLENGQRMFNVDLAPEYTDNVLYSRFVNGTTGALVILLASGANTYTFTLNVRFDGETPTVGDTGVVQNPLKAYAIGSTDAAAITCVTSNLDATL